MHPAASVHAIDDPGEDENPHFWAEYTIQILGRSPDIVFSSEDYGEPLARCLGCRHVMVDRERVHVPITASAVRSEPMRHWEFLESCVRGYFAKRICVVGAESTGTTTLARRLAEHYKTVWVPEYAREYCESLQAAGVDLWTYPPSPAACVRSGRTLRCAAGRAREANHVLICDSDVLSTGIWQERCKGTASAEVEPIAGARQHDLYLLTDCDIPFVQDGLRDGPSGNG
jgi:HTH-type transcriptional repressor of NAD biosynthesis genes